jgi:hypothetical protein
VYGWALLVPLRQRGFYGDILATFRRPSEIGV